MSQNQQSSSNGMGTMLLTFAAGAAVGAVIVALTTPKSGPDLRVDLKDLARRSKRKAGEMADEACESWEDLKDRTGMAAADLKRGMTDAANDLRG